MGIMNCAENLEVGVLKELNTNIRQAVDIGSGENPPVPAVLATTFFITNEDCLGVVR